MTVPSSPAFAARLGPLCLALAVTMPQALAAQEPSTPATPVATPPAGRPRVRQFVVPQAACDGLGQVLFNGAQTCEQPATANPADTPAAALAACDGALRLSTRTQIEVTG